MSTWIDIAKWQQYKSQKDCPVCNQEQDNVPPSECHIARLRISKLIAYRNTCMKGHCCLVPIPHVIELYDLSDADAEAFMHDICQASEALQKVRDVVKINYKIGNSIPHLHMHLWPQQVGDRFKNAPIDWRKANPSVYSNGEFEAFIAAMRGLL